MRDFLTSICPIGLPVDHFEMMLNGVHLTEQLVECWNGFYARIVMTYHEVLPGFSQPYVHLRAPLPHLAHQALPGDLSQHIVFIPRGTSLLFSNEFRAMGMASRWQKWLPQAVQQSAVMIRPVAFVLREVHDSIQNEMPVCPIGTRIFALVPALTPSAYPTVIAAKIIFLPLVATGAVFCPDLMNRIGVLRHLGLEGMLKWSGGSAILLPPGWQAEASHELVCQGCCSSCPRWNYLLPSCIRVFASAKQETGSWARSRWHPVCSLESIAGSDTAGHEQYFYH